MNLRQKKLSVEMEEIKEDVCIPCLNKSDIREVLNRLETMDKHLTRIDQRLVDIEHFGPDAGRVGNAKTEFQQDDGRLQGHPESLPHGVRGRGRPGRRDVRTHGRL